MNKHFYVYNIHNTNSIYNNKTFMGHFVRSTPTFTITRINSFNHNNKSVRRATSHMNIKYPNNYTCVVHERTNKTTQ